MRHLTAPSSAPALLVALAMLGCSEDPYFVTGTFVDSDMAPIASLTVDCGPRKVVTDLDGAFECRHPADEPRGLRVDWRNERIVIGIDPDEGDLDLGPLPLIETAPAFVTDGSDVVFTWPALLFAGTASYRIVLGSDLDPIAQSPLTLHHATGEPSFRLPAIAIEDWQLLAEVEGRVENEVFVVSTISASTPFEGTSTPLSRGASCRWSYLDGSGNEIPRGQEPGECMFTDGLLDRPDQTEIVEVTIDLGTSTSISRVIVRDHGFDRWEGDDAASWEDFDVEVGNTQGAYRPAERTENGAIKEYRPTGSATARFVRLRASSPGGSTQLAEVSVF